MNNSRDPHETHSLSFHPTVWQWISQLAREEYEGNVSAAVTGLILYDRGIRNAKRLEGQPHHHYITQGLPGRRDLLEAALKEIESQDPGFNAKTWLEIQRSTDVQSVTPPQPLSRRSPQGEAASKPSTPHE